MAPTLLDPQFEPGILTPQSTLSALTLSFSLSISHFGHWKKKKKAEKRKILCFGSSIPDYMQISPTKCLSNFFLDQREDH